MNLTPSKTTLMHERSEARARLNAKMGHSHLAALSRPVVVEFNRQPRSDITPSPAALEATAADELRWRNAIEQYRKQAEGNPNHWAADMLRRGTLNRPVRAEGWLSPQRPTRETHVIVGDHDPEPRVR